MIINEQRHSRWADDSQLGLVQLSYRFVVKLQMCLDERGRRERKPLIQPISTRIAIGSPSTRWFRRDETHLCQADILESICVEDLEVV